MTLVVYKVDFDIILEVWKQQLWPNRKSEIRTMSSMQFLGGTDMSIYEKYVPSFWAVSDNDNIIGVNSGFATSDASYRSRGIWVNPTYRSKGIAQLLFDQIDIQASKESKEFCWSIPRKKALPAYEKAGYVKCSDWFDKGMDFGPNCYVEKILNV
jgi:GNAT superfamily N-acetyltransferase